MPQPERFFQTDNPMLAEPRQSGRRHGWVVRADTSPSGRCHDEVGDDVAYNGDVMAEEERQIEVALAASVLHPGRGDDVARDVDNGVASDDDVVCNDGGATLQGWTHGVDPRQTPWMGVDTPSSSMSSTTTPMDVDEDSDDSSV